MKLLSLLLLFTLTSCQIETRIWKDCNPAMIEDYKLIRELQDNGFPNIDAMKCEQVFQYVDQGNGALECRFDEDVLDTECRPNTWYEGTGFIRLTSDMVGPLYYEKVDPCEGPLGKQGCSMASYFVELETW